jgi:hypothetical protein
MFRFGVLGTVLESFFLCEGQHFAAPIVGNLEFVGRKFDDEAVVIARIQRVEDPTVELVVVMTVFFESGTDLFQSLGLVPERDVVDTANRCSQAARIRLPPFFDEERENASVSCIEEQVSNARRVEIGLFEDEGHAEHVPVERNCVLDVAPYDRDVIHPGHVECTLRWGSGHGRVGGGRLRVSHGFVV